MNETSQVDQRALDGRGERTLLVFAYGLAFIQGLTIQLMPVLFQHVGETFRVGLSKQGGLQSAFFMGSFIVGFGGGTLFERLGYRRTAISSLALLGLGAFTIGCSPSLWVLLGGGVLFGIGNAWLTVIYSAVIARHSGRHRQRVFTWALLIMAFGGAIGPVLLGFALKVTSTWRTALFLMAVLVVLAILFFRLARLPALDFVEKWNNVDSGSFWWVLRRKRLWLIGFMFILHALGGGVLVSWIGRLYELRCGIDAERAALLLSVNAAGFFFGRFVLGTWLSDRLPDRVLLALCATGATVAYAFLLIGNSYKLALLLMWLEGFVMSGDAPSISSLTAKESVAFEGVAFAFVQALSALGSIVAPWLVGAMGEHYGLSRAIWAGPLFLFSLAVMSIAWEMYDNWRPQCVEGRTILVSGT